MSLRQPLPPRSTGERPGVERLGWPCAALLAVLKSCALLLFAAGLTGVSDAAETKPNIVLIVADDLGYGDLGCYGGKSIPTPRIDRMAREGIRLTRCYAPAATCTPTRYAILTGEYAWRQKVKRTNILDGDAPLAIAPGRPTLPEVLRRAGYQTALVGKWHLGIGDGISPVDFNGHVAPGPMEVGFDRAFYIPATVDRVPCVYLDGHAVHGHDPSDPIRISYSNNISTDPTGIERPDLLRYGADKQHSGTILNGISRIGFMSGGHAARWVDEDITDTLAARADQLIQGERDKPFFLMLGAHDPHVPHSPHPRFVGKSSCGTRGDSIVQFDWLVGSVLDSLAEAGVDDNTLVILTSDNGPTVFDGYFDGSVQALGDHRPAEQLRGGKYLVYEGGCRVPCLVRWPGVVSAGSGEARFSLVDLLASLARISGVEALPAGVGADGVDRSRILLDPSARSDDRPLVLQGVKEARALLMGDWKFVPRNTAGAANDIGRGANPRDKRFVEANIHQDALYNLQGDPSESQNVIADHPEKAAEMRASLANIIESR